MSRTGLYTSLTLIVLLGTASACRLRENSRELSRVPDTLYQNRKVSKIEELAKSDRSAVVIQLGASHSVRGARCQKIVSEFLADCLTVDTGVRFTAILLEDHPVCRASPGAEDAGESCIDRHSRGYLVNYSDFTLHEEPAMLKSDVDAFLAASIYRNIPDTLAHVFRSDNTLYAVSENNQTSSQDAKYQVVAIRPGVRPLNVQAHVDSITDLIEFLQSLSLVDDSH